MHKYVQEYNKNLKIVSIMQLLTIVVHILPTSTDQLELYVSLL